MQGIRFYLEHDSPAHKRRREHNGNVIAIAPANRCPDGSVEAIGAVYFYPNSPVASTAAGWDYLRTRCKRIAEREARQIHPALFERLDMAE